MRHGYINGLGKLDLADKLSGTALKQLYDNIMLNAFRVAINGSLTKENMIDGITDEYEDETGIDTVNSLNEDYDSANDLYKPTVIAGLELDYMEYASDGAAQAAYVSSDSDVDGQTTFIDSGNTGHTVTEYADAQLDTAQKKWGNASGLFDGAGDYLSIPDSADWDIFGSNSDNWTIDFWVRFNNYTTPDLQYFMCQFVDGENHWRFMHYGISGGLTAHLRVGGSNVITLPVGLPISDNTTWHHIALCKVADKYAIYKDGAQANYVQDSSIGTFGAPINIARRGDSGNYFNGRLDELRIQKSNVFSAAPVVGLSDTISVPTGPHTSDSNTKLLLHFNGTPNLQDYSEASIKNQGSYSLKAIAAITDSLNDTLTKSGLSIDLTDKDTLKIDVRSSRTGTNLRVKLHDSGAYTSDQIPTMTSNTAPSGVASASNEAGWLAYYAFNDVSTGTDQWLALVASAWLQYQFSSSKIITKYTIKSNSDAVNVNRLPKDWTFKGSNTGAFGGEEVILDTVTGETGWSALETRIFTFANSNPYTYYRLDISANNGGGFLSIGEMEMMEEDFHTKDIVISQVDTWTEITWDISGIANAQKDAIDSIIIKVINADSANTFYVDNFYAPGITNNMTLLSNSEVADAQPDAARIVLFEEDVDSITENTDIKAYVSRDGGTTFTQVTLSDAGDYSSGKRILVATIDISGQPAGTNMEYKITTLNNKLLKLHGCGLLWD